MSLHPRGSQLDATISTSPYGQPVRPQSMCSGPNHSLVGTATVGLQACPHEQQPHTPPRPMGSPPPSASGGLPGGPLPLHFLPLNLPIRTRSGAKTEARRGGHQVLQLHTSCCLHCGRPAAPTGQPRDFQPGQPEYMSRRPRGSPTPWRAQAPRGAGPRRRSRWCGRPKGTPAPGAIPEPKVGRPWRHARRSARRKRTLGCWPT
mmetsp:Transcript_46771/g.119315  ORF Transcript_46771/g.119315 Transcript_46771/m.119315 type:complete len:204 (+) Transcript_46771:406-1017(+)